jgi:Dual specificity phosphatase, catalytic domain
LKFDEYELEIHINIEPERMTMEIFQIDQDGKLFISPDIDDWKPITDNNITAIFDLEGGIDIGIPTIPDHILYIYFPFEDQRALPDLQRLHETAKFGACLIKSGYSILSHCGMGHNRSALLAGVILTYLGMTGEQAVTLIQKKRKGALYNKVFASYLQTLPSARGIEESLNFVNHPIAAKKKIRVLESVAQ